MLSAKVSDLSSSQKSANKLPDIHPFLLSAEAK